VRQLADEKSRANCKTKRDAAALYEDENLNLRQIAARFGVIWQAIHQKLTKAGVPMSQKSPVKRLLDRETLVQLYIEKSLTIAETAQRLKAKFDKVSDELERHGIEKRSIGYFKRKHPELYQLKVGEKAIIQRPSAKNPYVRFYEKAKRIGIRISIRSVNEETFQIKRIK